MQQITRRAALTLATTGLASVAVQAHGAQAYGTPWRIYGDRDLTPEIFPTSHGTASAHHNMHGVFHVGVLPIGPSSIAIGTPFALRMVSTADGFAGLYVLSASGRTQAWFENVRFHAGKSIVYPQRGVIVRATPPAGDETVILTVSRDRMEGFSGAFESAIPLDLQYTHEGLRAAIQQKFNELRRERWAFAEIQIRVHD